MLGLGGAGLGSADLGGDGLGGAGLEDALDAGGGGGSSAVTHTYWRVRFGANNSAQNLTVAEIEFRATAGGADQATGGTATESAFNVAGQEGASAFDNNNATFYASPAELISGQWIRYQFAAPVEVAEVGIRARDTSAGQAPRVAFVEGSDDGTSFTTYYRMAAQTAWGVSEIRSFTVGSTSLRAAASGDAAARRYWRIIIDAINGASIAVITAMDWLDSNDNSISLYADVLASGQNTAAGEPFQNASALIDGSDATFWASPNGGAVNSTIRFDFFEATLPAKLRIKARADANDPTQALNDFRIQSSPDGTNWTTTTTVLDETAWTQGEERIFTI